MKAFYRGLGWSPSVDMDSFALFVLGSVGLGLFAHDDLAEEAGADDEPAAPSGPTSWRGFSLALNLDEQAQVDEVYAAWVAAGATPMTAPVDRPWGGRTGYVADPEGNRWEIAWAPTAVFDERGGLVSFA